MATHFKLKLFGPLRLCTPDGVDVTPRSAKAQGLLAILALSHGQPWNRAALQDLLWSDRGPAHGRDSLKKALSELRHALNRDGECEVLQTSGGPVALAIDRLRVDVFHEPPSEASPVPRQELLAGIDIRDPQFEEWLRLTRQGLSRDPCLESAVPTVHRQWHRMHVAVLPTLTAGGDHVAQLFGGLLRGRVIDSLRAYDVYKLLDRPTAAEVTRAEADAFLKFESVSWGSRVVISISCMRVADHESLWGRRFEINASGAERGAFAVAVNEITDQITDCLFRKVPPVLGDDRLVAARAAMDGIASIFKLTKPSLERSAASFRNAIEIDPRGTYFAWYAFLSAFELERTRGRRGADLRAHADTLARRALEEDPNNPLTRSLLTHVYSFVFRDFERAETIIRPLDSCPPDNALYYHSRALLGYYTGRLSSARHDAKRAAALGRNGPYGYGLLTVRSIVELASGRLDEAARFGEAARAAQKGCQSQFLPNLRYLVATHSLRGDIRRARARLNELDEQAGGFSIDQMREYEFPIPSEGARALLLDGFERLRSVEV
ncbi:hypothetical protein [uncultured Marivita sp.]|uniref:hypothetical protein n=1 Tax=uncultured Marivita sp. TaxID=888080 RepID=UPI002612F2A8|nr:hypothetical protein [uncultured Marivita sp.]